VLEPSLAEDLAKIASWPDGDFDELSGGAFGLLIKKAYLRLQGEAQQ